MFKLLDYFKTQFTANTFEVEHGAVPHRLDTATLSELRMSVIVMALPGTVLVKCRSQRKRVPAVRVWCVEGQEHRMSGHMDALKPKDGTTLHSKVYLGTDIMANMRDFILAINKARAVERILALEK